jgi:hypothetical protein
VRAAAESVYAQFAITDQKLDVQAACQTGIDAPAGPLTSSRLRAHTRHHHPRPFAPNPPATPYASPHTYQSSRDPRISRFYATSALMQNNPRLLAKSGGIFRLARCRRRFLQKGVREDGWYERVTKPVRTPASRRA